MRYKKGVCVCCDGTGKSNDDELKSLIIRDINVMKGVFSAIEGCNPMLAEQLKKHADYQRLKADVLNLSKCMAEAGQ